MRAAGSHADAEKEQRKTTRYPFGKQRQKDLYPLILSHQRLVLEQMFSTKPVGEPEFVVEWEVPLKCGASLLNEVEEDHYGEQIACVSVSPM